VKKLLGKTEIEDALKRLDKLTQEEVRMATAQLLTLTHGVDDKVTRIDDEVKSVDGKVTRIGDKVESVDGKATRIGDEIKCVGGKVNDIGDTVRVVHEGARYVIFPTHSFVNVHAARWKRNTSNRATDSKRGDCDDATNDEQRQRSNEFVVL
jgi:hypothetical protein